MKLYALLVLTLIFSSCALAQNSRKDSVPAELIGKWYAGSSSSLAFLNRTTGISNAAGGDGVSLEIKADGTYAKAIVKKVGLYGCSTVAFGYQTGKVKATAGDALLFTETENYVSYKDSCNPLSNTEKNKPPRKLEYQYELKTGDDGKTLLCVRNDNGEDCYAKSPDKKERE